MISEDEHIQANEYACPSFGVLECHVRGEPLNKQTLQHIESCPLCQTQLDDMRQIDAFLTNIVTQADEALDASPEWRRPDSIKGLTISKEIGRGGQGVVYEAVQEAAHRTVAIKVLLRGAAAREGQLARFQRETRLAASLHHPHIVTIHDALTLDQGQLAYVMQRVHGISLDKWRDQLFKKTPRPRDRRRSVLTVFVKIVQAVAYAHSKGVVHRDLKPSNVLVDADNEPHILDFGIACALGESTQAHESLHRPSSDWSTRTNEFVGSPHFAAPEQLQPGASVDERTDVYSLGVMLKDIASQDAATNASNPPYSASADHDWIVARATEENPSERYPTAAAMADDIRRLLSFRPIKARPSSIPYRIHRVLQRHPIVIALAVGTVILSAAASFKIFNQRTLIEQRSTDINQVKRQASIDRAISLLESGSYLNAQDQLWNAWLTGSPEDNDLESDRAPARQSAALWGLRAFYAKQPSLASFQIDLPHKGKSITLGFDPSGALLFALSDNGTLETWDWKSGNRLSTDQLTDGPAHTLLMAAHTSLVAAVTNHDPAQVSLYDMKRHESIGSFDFAKLTHAASPEQPPALAFTDGARRLAIGVGDTALLYDRTSDSVVRLTSATIQSIASLDFDAKGERLLFTSSDGKYEIWDTATGQSLQSGRCLDQSQTPDTVREGWFLPGQEKLVFASSSIPVIDLDSGVTQSAGWHDLVYSHRVADPRTGWIATSLANEIVVRNSIHSGVAPVELLGHRRSIKALALNGEKQLLASIDISGAVCVWDISGNQAARVIQTPSSTVFSVDFSPDGDTVFSGDTTGAVRSWSWGDGESNTVVKTTLKGMVSRIAVSPNGAMLAVGGHINDPRLLVLSLPDEFPLLDIQSLYGRVTGLAFSPDSQRLVATASRECILVDFTIGSTPTVHRTMRGRELRGVDFSRDGSAIVSTEGDEIIRLASTTMLALGPAIKPPSAPRHVAVSPIGDMLVVDGDDSVLRMFNLKSGEPIGELIGHSLRDHWMDFNTSGDLLLSAGEDNVLKIWDTKTRRCLATFDAFGSSVYCARFAPNSLRAATGDTQGKIGLWDFGGLDRSIAGNLETQIARFGANNLPTQRLSQLRRWASSVSQAE